MDPRAQIPLNVDVIKELRAAEEEYQQTIRELHARIDAEFEEAIFLGRLDHDEEPGDYGDAYTDEDCDFILGACQKLALRLCEAVSESALRRDIVPAWDSLAEAVANRVSLIARHELPKIGIAEFMLRSELMLAGPLAKSRGHSLVELVTIASGVAPGDPSSALHPAKLDLGMESLRSEVSEQEMRASRRKAVVHPLLKAKKFKPGGWATKAGVPSSVVYDYLGGKTKQLNGESRECLAEALGLSEEELPE